ncbi:hypothetical protein D1007_07606 [Hordeum vulgare]|nr:hypothetical protein D1007_07606 [Hordeum vulgare]
MLINSKVGKRFYLLDPQHLPVKIEFEYNIVVMDPSHPTSATSHVDVEAEAHAQEARATSALVSNTKSAQMTFLISTIQGMEKNIKDILLNHRSLERIVETKFHDPDIKVIDLTTTVNQLKQEVEVVSAPSSSDDDDSPPIQTHTQFRTQARYSIVPLAESRQHPSAPASTPSTTTPPVSTPPPH